MQVKFRKSQSGCIGAIHVPTTEDGTIVIAAVGDDKADALVKAALIAERVASDPVLRALMPPQAQAAIMAAKGLGVAAQHGSQAIRSLFHRLRGPGKQRLATVLHAEASELEQSGDVGAWFRRKKRKKLVRRRREEREQDDDQEQEDPQPAAAEQPAPEAAGDDDMGDDVADNGGDE